MAVVARREGTALPSELARKNGSRLDPKFLREERDHLVIGLASRRLLLGVVCCNIDPAMSRQVETQVRQQPNKQAHTKARP